MSMSKFIILNICVLYNKFMENLEKIIAQEATQKQVQMKSQTEQINEFIEMYGNAELTQQVVQDWIDSFPEDEKEDVKYALECGIGENVEKLP